jgi:cytochrome b561
VLQLLRHRLRFVASNGKLLACAACIQPLLHTQQEHTPLGHLTLLLLVLFLPAAGFLLLVGQGGVGC